MKRILGLSIALLTSTITVLLVAMAPLATSASATTACDLYASPTGSDANPGTSAAPFQSVQQLVSSLGPGQTGCLMSGDYLGNVTFRSGGQPGSPLTLTSAPGQSATVTGRMWITQAAGYVTVTGLSLDGVNSEDLPSPTVNGSDATFSYDDVTDDHTAICFDLGNADWGVAYDTVITDSRVHDCGILPARNYNHGIYVADAVNTQISWNEIYDNADRGIQLYPEATGTTIDHNIIDGNGEGILFSGDGGTASNDTQVYDNLITNSSVRSDVESWYPAGNPIGTNNEVYDNCVWGGNEGTIDTSGGGFSAYANQVVDPQYVDPAAGDYHLQPTSPCLAMTGDIAAAVDGQAATQPTSGSGSGPATGGSGQSGAGGSSTTVEHRRRRHRHRRHGALAQVASVGRRHHRRTRHHRHHHRHHPQLA